MSDRLVIGCMTGTSIDALDAALVRISGSGPYMRAELVETVSAPFGELAGPLRCLAEQEAMTAEQIATLALELSYLHIRAIRTISGHDDAELIAVHGQTVIHRPPVSWQLINATVIAHELHCPVVSDLRAADLAAGGQGAPITPIADWVLFRSEEESRVIANLGGFCNITLLPRAVREDQIPDALTGRDICPCNHLLDRIARRCFDAPYDTDGARALAGKRNDAALTELAEQMRSTAADGRSLGTGDELDRWIDESLAYISPEDLAATACAAIGMTLGARHPGVPTHLVLAGGGTRNLALLDAIRDAWSGPVSYSDQLGIPAEAREASAMAIIGALCADREPVTRTRTTGVEVPPISGVWVRP